MWETHYLFLGITSAQYPSRISIIRSWQGIPQPLRYADDGNICFMFFIRCYILSSFTCSSTSSFKKVFKDDPSRVQSTVRIMSVGGDGTSIILRRSRTNTNRLSRTSMDVFTCTQAFSDDRVLLKSVSGVRSTCSCLDRCMPLSYPSSLFSTDRILFSTIF